MVPRPLDDEPVIISADDAVFPRSTPQPDHAAGAEEPEPALVSETDDEIPEKTGIAEAETVGGAPAKVATAVVSESKKPDEIPVVSKPLPRDVLSAMPGPSGASGSSPAPSDDEPSARQIVSVIPAAAGGETSDDDDNEGSTFRYHEAELNGILAQVPPGWKVSVVSVVGAFRTGKSFLLSWFLRYLEEHCSGSGKRSAGDGDGKKWYERIDRLDQKDGSFDWRGGAARNTTGMWMWSRPYFMSDNVAILLVDTQGMFDHETTVGLTAAIFGLSTLLSSYQIYNVDKRIQEDNLQQLALFTEYGRMAMETEEKAAELMRAKKRVEGDSADDDNKGDAATAAASEEASKLPPFQRIEFLIRDWQNFDTDDDEDIVSMEIEMAEYLEHVLAERKASDLKNTREQINSCFQDVGCYMLTHPGFAVAKNKYDGDVSKIEPQFLLLLDRYCRRVFGGGDEDDIPRLEPKTIRGRQLAAVELGNYIKAYANMFEEIGAHFPKPETMLEATSKANNDNALQNSDKLYSEAMNLLVGPNSSDYLDVKDLRELHKTVSEKSLLAFDNMANFGSRRGIETSRERLVERIRNAYEIYDKLNASRNPLLGFETFGLPLVIGFCSYVMRWIADVSCSEWSQTCRASSDLLSHVYMVVFFFLAIVASTKAQQIKRVVNKLVKTVELLTAGLSDSGGDDKKKND